LRRDGARAQRPQPLEQDVRNVKRTAQAACCGGRCAALISAVQSLLRGRNYGCLACCTLVLQGRGHPQRHADEGCSIGGCRLGNSTRSEYIVARTEAHLQYRADAFAPVLDTPAHENGGALRALEMLVCVWHVQKHKNAQLERTGTGTCTRVAELHVPPTSQPPDPATAR
jgi:hypothetical protein